jgi:hypothetical protein
MSDTGLRRVQVTAGRSFPEDGLVPWALDMACGEAVAAGAARMLVTHGAARGGDRQAHAWARAQAPLYAAGYTAIEVLPDPMPADWKSWCPQCTDGTTRAAGLPSHDRRRRHGPQRCPDAGFRRNSAMVAKDPPARRGLAFFTAGLRNSGTLDCSVKMFHANVPLRCFCDACGLRSLDGPCRRHSARVVLDGWDKETGVLPIFSGA